MACSSLFLIVAAALMSGAGACAARSSPLQPTADFQAVEQQMNAAIADHSLPSVSVAVIRGGRIVWMKSAGWADIEARKPATSDTVYRIGSVSKSITATVAVAASRRGDIDLSRAVTFYLPQLANRSDGHFRSVSVQALLNMNAGMTQTVHYRGLDRDVAELTEDRLVADYAVAPFRAGPRYLYSNMGPELVARSIGAASARGYRAYARRTLLAPLGMTSTFFASADVPSRVRAQSYGRSLKPFALDYEVDPVAGAGMLTSARDLAAYAAFHLTGRAPGAAAPLTLADLQAMHTPRSGFYSYGWGTIGAGDLAVLISDGQVNGGQAVVLLAPAKGVGVVVLANAANDVVNQIALTAIEVMAPGIRATFERGAAKLEADHARSLEPFYPPAGAWTTSGRLLVAGAAHRLSISTLDSGVSLVIDGATPPPGKRREPDDGFATWSIRCIKVLPACRDEPSAEAVLSLTRADEGLDGVIAVESRLGLFPYEVHLRPVAPSR